MADKKITDFLEDTAPTANDLLLTVDVETGQSKKVKLSSLVARLVYPVGSIYTNSSDATNPATLLGFGTWIAFGAGRVPVGFNSAQIEFNAAEKTGGAMDLQRHNHGITDPGHYHQERVATTGGAGTGISGTAGVIGNAGATQDTGSAFTAITVNDAGTGLSGNLQPYITVYMWKRTA